MSSGTFTYYPLENRDLITLVTQRNYRHLQWEREDGDRHGGVHEEQHVEEEKAEVTENLGTVVADVVVESTNQKPDQDVGE